MAETSSGKLNIPPEAIRTMKKDLAGITRGEWDLTLAEAEIQDLLQQFQKRQKETGAQKFAEQRTAKQEQEEKQRKEEEELTKSREEKKAEALPETKEVEKEPEEKTAGKEISISGREKITV